MIDERLEELRAFLHSLDAVRTPGARLKALARAWVADREEIAVHGCPFGSLCSDLNKHDRAWTIERLRSFGTRWIG